MDKSSFLENISPKKRHSQPNSISCTHKIKHSEIDNLSQGCLEHIIYGIGTLAVLFKLLHPACALVSKLFGECGFFKVQMDREKDFF